MEIGILLFAIIFSLFTNTKEQEINDTNQQYKKYKSK